MLQWIQWNQIAIVVYTADNVVTSVNKTTFITHLKYTVMACMGLKKVISADISRGSVTRFKELYQLWMHEHNFEMKIYFWQKCL